MSAAHRTSELSERTRSVERSWGRSDERAVVMAHGENVSNTVPGRVQDLTDAFATFNRVSNTLVDAYTQLVEQMERLQDGRTSARHVGEGGAACEARLAHWLSNLVNALPVALVVVDGDGSVQFANSIAEAWLGSDLRGQAWRAVLARSFRTLEDEGPDISLSDGRIVNISTCPLGMGPGQIVVLQDVSENRHLQQRISHYKRLSAMGEMAASLAHQIRTPLASAMLYLSQLSRGDRSGDHPKIVRKSLDRLHDLNHILNNMLLFARGGTQDTENIPVSDLLHQIFEQSRPLLHKRASVMTIVDRASDAVIRGSRTLLMSLFHNVVLNALEACGQRGELRLSSAFDDNGCVLLSLQDNGRGIPGEIRKRVFEPFFTTRAQGTGLGLAIAQAIAHDHRAEIDLKSKTGHGTTISFRFPSVGGGRRSDD